MAFALALIVVILLLAWVFSTEPKDLEPGCHYQGRFQVCEEVGSTDFSPPAPGTDDPFDTAVPWTP